MKRGRENAEAHNLDMAKCLMFLSHSKLHDNYDKPKTCSSKINVFECKTCNRQFSSFQALGGHRASHKKSRLILTEETPKPKPNMHQCSICGVKFAVGQALGGHMRRHRVAMGESFPSFPLAFQMPVAMKRMNSSKRIVCLDLNLTPLENDLEFLFGKMAPKVDPFI